MKTRTGFVSNSSSSSFVLKIKDDNAEKKCRLCFRQTYSIKELIETGQARHSSILANGVDEIIDYYQNDKEIVDEIAELLKNEKNSDSEIILVDIDHYDKFLLNEIKAQIMCGATIRLYGDRIE